QTTFNTSNFGFETPANISTLFIKDDFADALYNEATKKGMKIDKIKLETVEPKNLFAQMGQISEQRKTGDPKLRNIVFMYIEPSKSNTHDELKLFERFYCMTTQHLKLENAMELFSNRPTMENVLLKLNVKGGGHNYKVKPEIFGEKLWMDRQTMIMGYDVWHPTGQSRADKMADRLPDPSVVGFSFNGGVQSESFIGDYHFQEATKERRSRGFLPPLIIVVRDGISDGQHSHGMDELEVLRKGANEYAQPPDSTYKPKFIFTIATKRHHKRAYMDGGRGPMNMPAMSVVDDTITSPILFEFFMQSHTPIKGMAKATRYIVLKDDVGTNQDAMQSLMGALCFEHQVSNNAISIPEPVYQSDEWAKRGASNMRKYKELFGEQGQFKKDATYEKLTRILSYWNSPLER
ncbi:hypothetical protein PMAYCL1PPCAC_24523, partial [Pristionchus mayeri]